MDDELEGCIADARIALSAAHDHLTRIEERARKVRAEIETTVRAAVQWEMRERIATAERERDEARAALAAARREGAEAMRERAARECKRVEQMACNALDEAGCVRVSLYVGRRDAADDCAAAIRALPLDAGGEP